jgi:hypothetical protein
MKSIEPKITAARVANALFKYRLKHGHVLAVPNCCVLGNEADFLSVTRAGLLYEHEIKLTYSDYLNEFRSRSKQLKHQWLKSCAESSRAVTSYAPNYFYFVTPKGMLKKGAPCPRYAGIIEFEQYQQSNSKWTLNLTLRRKPTRLHAVPLSEKQREKISVSLMYKLFNQRKRSEVVSK